MNGPLIVLIWLMDGFAWGIKEALYLMVTPTGKSVNYLIFGVIRKREWGGKSCAKWKGIINAWDKNKQNIIRFEGRFIDNFRRSGALFSSVLMLYTIRLYHNALYMRFIKGCLGFGPVFSILHPQSSEVYPTPLTLLSPPCQQRSTSLHLEALGSPIRSSICGHVS